MTDSNNIASVKSPLPHTTKKKYEIWYWVRFIAIASLIFILVNNLVGLVKVSGNSMNPTLQNGNVLLVNKISLFFTMPEYGDVVLVEEERLGYKLVKRVIAVGGDRVAIRDGITYVNGSPLVELYTYGKSEDMDEITIEVNHLFVVGDNRSLGESLDSRDSQFGPVHISKIKGFIAISLWPFRGIAKPLDLGY